MVTGYEVEMYANIGRIARALERIADHLGELVPDGEEDNSGNA